MTAVTALWKLPLLAGMLLAANCQSTDAVIQPAVLEQADLETIARLKSVVAAAMQKDRVEFGPGDLTVSPAIAALPPRAGPYEGHSLALPTYFDLAMQSGQCVIVRRETGEVFDAPFAACKLVAE